MSTSYPVITIKRGKEQAIKRRHPWIFTGAIEKRDKNIEDGGVVRVCDIHGEFMALGHFSDGPSIAIRLFSFEEVEISYPFWLRKIREAYDLRQILLRSTPLTNVYRLIHGEGDGMPGLIVDIYNETAVVQFHSIGFWRERDHIKNALMEIFGAQLKTIYNKSEGTMPAAFESEVHNEFWLGADTSGIVEEHGHKFIVDWVEGQKTGFFVDQRENRLLVKRFSQGRRVCNMFGYTGGFSIYAMAGGATHVDTVDASKTAIAKAAQNAALNFPNNSNHNAIVDDAFSYMSKFGSNYDLIILDPPAFAKHHNALENALKGYKRINQIALEKIETNGILFTFSCSQAVSMADFKKSVFVAAANAKRNVRIIHQLSQPADHPINIFHPEGDYLKGLVLHVV
jgi:23S rRNA (cytosine1962-C5)-methyltransferase